MTTAGGQIPPLDSFYNNFAPKCNPAKANFSQTPHLLSRSVKRRLDTFEKKTFFEFFGFSQILDFFCILTSLMMKNQLKWRLFLEYMLHHLRKKFKKTWYNPLSEHHRGTNA